MVKHEPEVRRAKAKSYVAWCNKAIHEAPWTRGDPSTTGGIYVALEMAEQAYKAHRLRYEEGLSNMADYSPRRFRWIYDEAGKTDQCVKLLDTETSKLVIWPHWAG
jgi:hypothetical protein